MAANTCDPRDVQDSRRRCAAATPTDDSCRRNTGSPRHSLRPRVRCTQLGSPSRPIVCVVTAGSHTHDVPPHVDLSTSAAGDQRLRELEAENARLRRLLKLTAHEARLPDPSQTAMFDRHPGQIDARSDPEAKVAFFRALFAARTDVYAVPWENARTRRSGWMPAVAGGFRKGQRPAERQYLQLTDRVVAAHLLGKTHIGLYPLLDGDHCHWLATDFDGPAAMLDALAYVKAARAGGAPTALEVSRSGLGAHVWLFFTGPIPAVLARELGTAFIAEAIALRGRMSLKSYDRLFPSQDVLSEGGIGNLLAAPLFGRSRRDGTTVFLDLATMEPYDDQWAYLSSLERLSPRQVSRIAERMRPPKAGSAVDRLQAATSTRISPQPAPVVTATLCSRITLRGDQLTPALLGTLKHAASMPNPEFAERQRRRASLWNIPRFITSFDETLDGDLVLPRGLHDTVVALVEQAGSSLEVVDQRVPGISQEFEFRATLRPEQQAAVGALAGYDLGVLVGRPGVGKTVIGCALVATRATSTLVLVDRKTLADQWRVRAGELLGVKVGQIGGGRSKLRGTLDVAMLQTLARRDDVAELTQHYGMVVVDECHHVPAAAFEYAVRQIPARTWLGLTATPYRRDGLDDLIGQQLGPVRHTVADRPSVIGTLAEGVTDELPQPDRRVVVHRTDYRYEGDADPSEPGGISAIYRDLALNQARNAQIVADVVSAKGLGSNCLVLTQRKDHLTLLDEQLRDQGLEPVVLRGGMSVKARNAAVDRVNNANGEPVLVIATGPFVGEGFDCPALDTLFLAAPIAFKGRLVQNAGRILRPYPGKEAAVVHDYHDVLTPVLASSLSKRAPGYASLGFPDPRKAV